MGKNLTTQKRGKGSSVYKSRSFRFVGRVKHKSLADKPGQIKGKIMDIVHSAGHSAPIAKILYEDRVQTLEIAPHGVKVGDYMHEGNLAKPQDGNVAPLGKIPEGTLIFNVESLPGDGGRFVRSSGSFARVLSRTEREVTVLLPSKKEHSFNPSCRATIGSVAGSGRLEKPIMKAGNMYKKKRAKGKKYPSTSALSMNAVDHPFGGSSSAHKGRPTIARKHAPAGAKVGMIRPRRSGRRRGKK